MSAGSLYSCNVFGPPDPGPIGSKSRSPTQKRAPDAYPGLIDPRIRRFEQVLTAIVLAAAFAFASRWLVTVWLVLLALSLVAEPIAPLRRAGAAFADRFRRPAAPIDAQAVRFATILAVGTLGLATVLLWVGIEPLGWLLVLAVAAAAALAALTQICLGCEAYAFIRRRTRRSTRDAT